MPQWDRRRSVDVPIEFEAVETLENLPRTNRVSLILATDGKANLVFSGRAMTLRAPSVLCLNEQDTLNVIESGHLFAQSFHLDPAFLKTRYTFKQIRRGGGALPQEEHQRDMLELFFARNQCKTGVFALTPGAYAKILEWHCIIGTEIKAQSDGRWTCRIRRYFVQILNLLDEIVQESGFGGQPEETGSLTDDVLDHFHAHYMDEIRLETLCQKTHVNRTSLNRQFKERTGQTPIAYLLSYRLRMARELLAHTGMTLDEIASATGFAYGTYLIRQFTSQMGESPTEYRKKAREKYGIVIEKV